MTYLRRPSCPRQPKVLIGQGWSDPEFPRSEHRASRNLTLALRLHDQYLTSALQRSYEEPACSAVTWRSTQPGHGLPKEHGGEDIATTGITDAKLIKMVRDSGHTFGPAILVTSKREKLSFAVALALVEQESNLQNIFGCDEGAPFCHQQVAVHPPAPAPAPAAGLTGAAVTIR
jgi:hypothetical protein